MNNNLKITALIGARSGSSLKNKNIKNYNGKPLLIHSIIQAQKSKYINNIYISTDSILYIKIIDKYIDLVNNNNIKIIMRPSEISGDFSSDFEYFKHFINNIDKNDIPDIIVQLRPTYPNRKIDIIDDAIKLYIDNFNDYDSLRSVIKLDKSAYKMYIINNNILEPFKNKNNNLIEPHNEARQLLNDTYLHNGYIDIIKTNTIINLNSISGVKILPYIMSSNENNDIDTLNDFKKSLKKNINNLYNEC